jgi:glycosyltransferase involved in cell wall biosynthesis
MGISSSILQKFPTDGMTLRILQVNHYVGPGKYCPRFRPTYLAREWVKRGHDVTIVGASFSHLFIRPPEFRGNRQIEWDEGVRYVLLKTPKYSGNGTGRMLNIVAFTLQLLRMEKWFARELAPDVVIAGSAHSMDSLPARRLARRCKAIFAREVRDLWPLTLTEIGGYPEWHPVVKMFRASEDYSYRTADKVITTLPNSLEYMQTRGLEAGRWEFIPHGAELGGEDPHDLPQIHQEVLAGLRARNSFILGYAGSHGVANCLDVLLDAAMLVRDTPAAFVLVGNGPQKDTLANRARELGLTNVHFLPAIRKECIPKFLCNVSAAFISWRKKPLYRYGISPNKLMDYMLAGKPIIHAVQAHNDLVSEAECGISVAPEDPGAFASAIRTMMLMSPASLDAMGRRGLDYIRAHNDYAKLAVEYLNALGVMNHES